jgi:hypothetical protein
VPGAGAVSVSGRPQQPLIEQVVTELQGRGDLKLRFIPVNTDESFLRAL